MMYESPESLVSAGGLRPVAGNADSIYMACASFEGRSLALPACLAADYRAESTVLYVNREFLQGPSADQTNSSLLGLERAFESRSPVVMKAPGSWLDPVEQLRVIRESLQDCAKRHAVRTITLDATTFNREALLVTLGIMRTHFEDARIRIVYASPRAHGTWLSRGYRKVRSVIGFSGIQLAGRRNALVVLSGFEAERTIKIIEEQEPSRVLLGIGDPPTVPDFLERNISEHNLVLSRADVQRFGFPANSIHSCLAALEPMVLELLTEYNVILAPMSTKLSTIAVFSLAQKYPDFQVTYCLPGEYNYADYSVGVSRIFVEDLA